MPIVFVHGVNTRKAQPGYDTRVSMMEQFLQLHLNGLTLAGSTVAKWSVAFPYWGDLATEFTPALDPGAYGGKDDLVVKLTPKKPDAQYKHLWLVVDPTDFHVKESVIREASDNLNHFFFRKLLANEKAKFSDKHFAFVPPAGVKVVKPEDAQK